MWKLVNLRKNAYAGNLRVSPYIPVIKQKAYDIGQRVIPPVGPQPSARGASRARRLGSLDGNAVSKNKHQQFEFDFAVPTIQVIPSGTAAQQAAGYEKASDEMFKKHGRVSEDTGIDKDWRRRERLGH